MATSNPGVREGRKSRWQMILGLSTLQSAFLTDTRMEVMNFNIWLYGSKESVQVNKHREFI